MAASDERNTVPLGWVTFDLCHRREVPRGYQLQSLNRNGYGQVVLPVF
jgi:hypothetical protein